MIKVTFPESFTWGVSTSAYQVEGYPLEEGAGPSNWHEFTHRRGTVKDGTNGDVACDHFHRYPEDVRAMAEMGLKGYRFSIAWTRIFPEPGKINEKGFDFYKRLIDALLGAGIEPWATIFHLEEPVWIARAGGMRNRSTVDHLVEFGTVLMRRLGDRVKNWITINEPTIYAYSGFALGEFPPGRRNDLSGMLRSVHHMLLAHSRLCAAFPSLVHGGMIGLAHHYLWVSPADPGRRAGLPGFRVHGRSGQRLRSRRASSSAIPRTIPEATRTLPPPRFRKGPRANGAGHVPGDQLLHEEPLPVFLFLPFLHAAEYIDPRAPRSGQWEIYPPGIYKALLRLKAEYGNPPCVITESGYPARDVPGKDPLDDPERIAYLADHVAMVGRAIAEGVDCRGYFIWSLLDNFEWNWGLEMRNGLLRTDYATLRRQWKKSASWYRELARKNVLEIDHLPAES